MAGERHLFRASGLYNGVFVMLDDGTGSVWSHLDGLALSGAEAGAQLQILPLQTTTWGAWLAQHPGTTTVDFETGYSYRDRVNLGASGIRGTFLETLGDLDPRLPENELVIGVLAGDEAVAFPIANLPPGEPMQAEVGGVPVVIFEDIEGMPALAYHRLLTDGTVLDFERREGAIYDLQTGSQWSASGRALEGDLAGVQLAFVTSFFTEWYGWAAFHPETGIFEGA